jgi:hypothetical protein
MSATVPPTPPAPPVATLTTALASVRGTVVSGPETPVLTQGLSVNAQVVSSGNGQIVLSSVLGEIVVQAKAALPEGTPVLLQVQSIAETVRVALNFQQNPAAAQGSGDAAPAQGAPISQTATPAAPSAPVVTQLTEGSVLQATVTRAATPGASPPGATPTQPGTPAQPAAAVPGAVQTASVTPGGAQPGATPAATSTATAPAAFPVGSNVTVRVLAVAPPGGELPAPAVLAAASGATPGAIPGATPGGRLIAATVSGHQASGAAVVTGDTADLALSSTHPLPTGSRLLLEVLELRPPVAGQDGEPLSFLGTGRWEALSDGLSLLQQIDPALARHVVDTAIPNPGPRLGATMLFVLSAVFSGDVRRFLGGEAMRQLGRAADKIGDRVSREFTQLERPASDAAGQNWRVFFIPVLTQEGLQQIRLMLRRNEDDGGAADGETGTRFMIEVNLTRLGPMQFDGLTRKKHLDLVVRTQQALPDEMGDGIRSIYGNTITALGFTGTIALRVVPRFDIAPVDQAPDSHKDLIV